MYGVNILYSPTTAYIIHQPISIKQIPTCQANLTPAAPIHSDNHSTLRQTPTKMAQRDPRCVSCPRYEFRQIRRDYWIQLKRS